MGFWIFMLITGLFMPIMLIGFGKWFQKHPPGQINSIYGYRTKMSMKNMETWDYAHRYLGKLWFKVGWIMLAVTLLTMMLLLHREEQVVSWSCTALMTVQCIVLILPIIQTEKELRRIFDDNGNKREI